MTNLLARAPRGRIEHFMVEGDTLTFCGEQTQRMARFKATERGQDSKIRPLCPLCRTIYQARIRALTPAR